jgi:hypothetical protein
LRNDLCIVGVEGKAEEPFGETVEEWMAKASGRETREARLAMLCGILGLPDAPPRLRYQLFHRAAACALEARHFGARTALLLVHSFSPKRSSFADFHAFATALGLDAQSLPEAICGPVRCRVSGEDIALYFGWVTDEVEHAGFWDELRRHGKIASNYSKSIADWNAKYGS